MAKTTMWQALGGRTFLLSSAPWRSVAYLLSGCLVGVPALAALAAGLAVGGALSVALIGLPLLAAVALAGLPVGAVERRRLRIVERGAAASPHLPVPDEGVRKWALARFRERATWRELLYTLLFATVLWPLDLLAVVFALTLPVGLLATPVMLATTGHGTYTMALKEWMVTSYPHAFALALLGLLLLPAAAYTLGALAGVRAWWARQLLT
ncbi:sensor domain-containing protein [Streptomyces sp. NPDC008313]|uniref:sensor domain-containing protein n=1 Tax=Streptomyces sp. NPDC008313 TaxID=3364826 RepID=UPI0036EC6D39